MRENVRKRRFGFPIFEERNIQGMKELLNTGVHIDLTYYEEENALIGRIKGYSAAVRENLSTGSYGVLLWAKKGTYAAVKTAEEYLRERQRLFPDLIKNFRVTDFAAAAALNRTEDPFVNINNLKRFLSDFADYLSLNFYVNCCCECGAEKDLGIYAAGSVITQACAACGASYRPILPAARPSGMAGAVSEPVLTAAPVSEPVLTAAPASEPVLTVAPVSESVLTEAPASEPSTSVETAENSGFDDLLLTARAEEKMPPKSALFEETEREFAREQAENPPEEENDSGFEDLLFESEMEEPPENPPDVIRAEKREKVPEIGFSELLINDGGEMELKKEEPEQDDGTVVTEIHDDSNDGDPVDVTELKSLVLNPTVTTGHPQLVAEETPLEKDGSVPLVNPTANREEKQVSPADGPEAVQPLETQKNAYSQTARPENMPYAVGFATAENMIDRDAPEQPSRQPHAAPPPYDPGNNYTSYVRPISVQSTSNAFMGVIGALTCGVIGVIVWVLIAYFLNLISSWGALAIVGTTFGGYYLAGRAMDKKGIVISLILSFVMTFAGVVAMTAADVCDAFSESFGVEIAFFDAIYWIQHFLQTDPEVKSEFFSNLGFSFAITGISAIVISASLWKKAD